jgi:hypothetical protein
MPTKLSSALFDLTDQFKLTLDRSSEQMKQILLMFSFFFLSLSLKTAKVSMIIPKMIFIMTTFTTKKHAIS